jgi:hypothetical protein
MEILMSRLGNFTPVKMIGNDPRKQIPTPPSPSGTDSPQESSLIEQLMRELEAQRVKHLELSQEVVVERRRTLDLESCLNQFLSPIPRVTSWGSIEESFPKISSLDSMSGLFSSSYMLPKAESFSPIHASASHWPTVPQVESWSSITNACLDLPASPSKTPAPSVGKYPAHIRQMKIRTYKEKQRRYKEKCRVSRVFTGRSQAAKKKLRVNGKFVKASAI